ncbi:HAD-IIB family hydrolase [Streptomyces sp. NPDC047928]|uniref:HAD-IIB family hydrolase n=1 Tax=unclassified Streptomyces TaxID=2593676 RepID=UPI00372392A5
MTDLDGTLLGGDEDGRRRLRRALDRHPEITVVFATGRGLASVRSLLARDPLIPAPRWIIGDVGSSVVDATDMSHVDVLEARLRAGWPGHDRVRDALRRFPRLVYQDGVEQGGRCSFYLHPEDLSRELTDAVEALGCSWVHSAGRYFDVLPPRADKGQAVRQLARKLQWPASGLLVAGDSLNDLSLFRLGAHGVVMGNAEPALSARLPPGPRLHRPPLEGAAALLSALERLGWVRPPASVVIGYHRPPLRWSEGRWRQPESPNGILPTLTSILGAPVQGTPLPGAPVRGASALDASAADGRGGLDAVWVWAAAAVDDAPAARPAARTTGLPLALLPLSSRRWAGYFHGACKETLWPALMSQPHLIRHDPAHWADYEAVNAAFARHIDAHAEHGATVWLHDYNLWLVPGILRAARPDLSVGLFHHTPFPEPTTFRRLPAAEELRASLSHLDWAGFHTSAFARNFRRLLADPPRASGPSDTSGTTGTSGAVRTPPPPRAPRTGVHPLGIDREAVAALAVARAPRLTARPDAPLVLSVERLDYTKAPVQKVRAVGALLERAPELRRRLCFRLVCPPPEPGIRAYDTTRTALERAVAAVNTRWGDRGWQPVDYRPRALPFPEVVDEYLAADVFWVTSLADGMNLTAKEYVAAQAAAGRAGVLVLSRHTGAAERFGTESLLTEPRSPRDLVDTLCRALAMTPVQRRTHITRLAALLDRETPRDWARAIVASIGEQPGGTG